MWPTLRRLATVSVVALVAFWVVAVGVASRHLTSQMANYPFLAEAAPLPHHVPQYEGGASLRFAMVHDVIHERYPRYGPDHYRERNRLTGEKLAALAADDPARFPLDDDLAVGLDRLGRPAEAVPLLRDKLARQQARGLSGRDLYTTYANLGTVLIHASYPKRDRGSVREGIALVRRSVEVNPEAHFGRERWQVAIAEFHLAALDDPKLLTTFDCLGNRLDRNTAVDFNRPTDIVFRRGEAVYEVPAFFRPGEPADWAEFNPIRKYIAKVGAEDGWDEVAVLTHRKPVPFDEPVLGIIGMWRQGGGANPHFALALGETMLRVGQRYIAWTAYERAARLADRYGSHTAAHQFLRDHCHRRQRYIEETRSTQAETQAVADLRPQFDAELSHGERHQREHQGDGREPIASPVGPEDTYLFVPRDKIAEYARRQAWAWGAFAAGVAAMLTALLLRLWPASGPRAMMISPPPA